MNTGYDGSGWAAGSAAQGAFSGANLANTIGVINQSALQWWATTHNTPVQSGQPGSLMRNVFGTDLSGGPTVIGQTASPIGVVLVIAIVVVGAVVLLKR